MAYVPPTTHVTLLATLQRNRLLPLPGEVAVQENQRVEAGSVIARAVVAKQHRLIDVARQLGVSPRHVDAFLVKHEGDTVKKDEPLASRRELFLPREVLSPVDGMVLAVGEGKALLALLEPPLEVRAGMPATVVKVLPDYGATIETTGALLEGVWGNGAEAFGVLRMLGSGLADALQPEMVDVELRHTIIAVGTLQDTAVFGKLAEIEARGLVIGSLRAELIAHVQKLPFPVLVVEGFGAQGFSSSAYTLLASNSGREAWINAQLWNRFKGLRPELIIPLPSPGQAPNPPGNGQPLAVGLRVRVTRGLEVGRVGQVLTLGESARVTASGVRAQVAMVQFEETEEPAASIPFANLEILE